MWDYNSLYEKAKDYVRKGLEHQEPSSTEVPLWCILSLELLARATLSNINSALLADLINEDSLLSTCGISTKKAPTSAPANVVFSRCMAVCEDFFDEDYKRCMAWLNWRNEELHTGKSPFKELPPTSWQPDYFRICTALLKNNNTKLADFVGKEQAKVATRMIESLSQEKKNEARDKVSEAKRLFDISDGEQRGEKLKEGSAKAKRMSAQTAQYSDKKCPSCGGSAVLVSDLIRSTTPIDSGSDLVQDDVWLPIGLRCFCCDLRLGGHAYVSTMGLGDQFVTTDILDPMDYYEIEPERYEEEW